MIDFLRKLLPNHTPPRIARRGGLDLIRERVLQTMLFGMVILGVPAIGFAAYNSFRESEYVLAAFYGLIFVWIAVNAIWRDWPLAVRTSTLIILAYLLAISEIYDSGLLGEMRFWLVTMVIITAIFTNFWLAIGASVLSAVTIVFFHFGIQNGFLIVPKPQNYIAGTGYITAAAINLMISFGLAAAISQLLSGLEKSLKVQESSVLDLQGERVQLESRVEERTQDVQRRLVQVRTAADISRAISRLTDPEAIFQRVVDLIHDQLGVYYAGIFLLDAGGKNAVLRAGTGEAGQAMLAQHHSLFIGGSSMIGWCIANRQPRIALDVGGEAVRFNNPFLPHTRSELALPIMSRGIAVGAITIQSERAQAFDQDDILILQGISDSLAIAVENSRLYAEVERNLEEVRVLNRNYIQEVWTDTLDESGEVSAEYSGGQANRGVGGNLTSLPISLRDQVIGQLTLDIAEEGLSEDDLTFIDALTTQTALALENARLVQETERRAVQEQKLNAFSSRFNRAQDVEAILKAALEEFSQLPYVAEATIQLLPASSFDQPASPSQPGDNGKEQAK